MVYKTCLSQFDSHMHEAQVEGQSAGGLFTLYSYHTLWNSLQAVCKWLCSLHFFPWTLLLTQVMTAGLAGTPIGRGHTCPETHARCSAASPEVKGHQFHLGLGVGVWGGGQGVGRDRCRRKWGHRVERLGSFLVLAYSHLSPRRPPTDSPRQEEKT